MDEETKKEQRRKETRRGQGVRLRAPSQKKALRTRYPRSRDEAVDWAINALPWFHISSPSRRNCQTQERGTDAAPERGAAPCPGQLEACQYALAVQTARKRQLDARVNKHPRLPQETHPEEGRGREGRQKEEEEEGDNTNYLSIWAGIPKMPSRGQRCELPVSSQRSAGGNDCMARRREEGRTKGERKQPKT